MQDRATDKLLPVGEHVCLACSGKAAGAFDIRIFVMYIYLWDSTLALAES